MAQDKETQLPALTSIDSVKEALDVRLGRRGDPLDRAVTLRDMIGSGLSFRPIRRPGQPGQPSLGLDYLPPTPTTILPPTPTGLVAQSNFGGINLLWDTYSNAWNMAYMEVYRATDTTTPPAELALLTVETGNMYFDVIDSQNETLYYYWIRLVSNTGHFSPYVGPVSASVIPLVTDTLERLSGEINESHFVLALNDRIDLIEINETGIANEQIARENADGALAQDITTVTSLANDNAAAVQTEQTARVDADGALAQDITTVQSQVGDDIASVQTDLTTEINLTDGEISDLGAAFTLKLDVNGYISGYTTYNTGLTSAAVWRVDTFAVGDPNNLDYYPFIIDAGVVYIDTAMIADASIQEGQLGAISVGKLTKNDGTPITTVGGLLRADAIDADSLNVNSAATFTGDVYSTSYSAGLTGWAILQNGTIEFNEGFYRGPVEFGNVTGSDKPANNADVTGSNTAYDTSNVGGTAATTVRDNAWRGDWANDSVNYWTRPGQTLIDGNKIYTGDAYVDTLQLKGQAVTIPVSSYVAGDAVTSENSWTTVASVWIDPEGAAIDVVGVVSVDAYSTDYASSPNEDVSVVAQASLEVQGRLLFNGAVVYTFGIGSGSAQREDTGSFSVRADVETHVPVAYRSATGLYGGQVYYIQVYYKSDYGSSECRVRNRFLSAKGVQR